MSEREKGNPPRFSRRAALTLAAPLALTGCGLFNGTFLGPTNKPLPGKRQDVMAPRHALRVDTSLTTPVTLPPAKPNPDWPQPGENAAHDPGHPAFGGRLAQTWRTDIGAGSTYRNRITATPVVAGGRVHTMDSAGHVDAFDIRTGRRIWRFNTRPKGAKSTNVGGGVSTDGGRVYAATGLAEVLAMDAATGRLIWRKSIPGPARSAPTVADGRLFVALIGDQIVALSTKDGARLWTHQAQSAATSILGLPAPAVADGLVVTGFGSGALLTLRADSGSLVWSDSLASAGSSLLNLSAITAPPVIDRNRVFAIGLGGVMLSLDLRAGRRLWERDVAGGQMPWVAGDWVFILSSDQKLACLSRTDGTVRWVSSLPAFRNMKHSRGPIFWWGPILAGGRLLVASTHNQLATINPQTGAILTTTRLPGPAALAPIIAGGTTYLITSDATLLALG